MNKSTIRMILGTIFILYLAITLVAAIRHQPWRDEAQSWLIARDLNPLGIVRQMPYEGTPPLWHLMLYPFAASGLPYSAEFVLNYLIAALAIFLLIFFSPLPDFVKITLPLSYYFLFEYSVVARNYGLITLLLFLVAALYPNRFKRPFIYALAISLLAWSGIQALGVTAALTVYFTIETLQNRLEDKKYLIALMVMIIAQLAVIIMLIPYPGQLYEGSNFTGFSFFARAAASALLPFFDNDYMPAISSWLLVSVWLVLIPCLLRTKTARIIYLVSSVWMMYIVLFKNSGGLRHYGLFLMTFIFAWWIDIYYQPLSARPKKLIYFATAVCLLACLAGDAGYSAYYYYTNRQIDFSGAKEMADYLKANNLANEEIASYPAIAGSALLPYLPGKKFYQMERGEKGTYLIWDSKFYYDSLFSYWEIKDNLYKFYERAKVKPKSVLILTTSPIGEFDFDPVLITTNKKSSITDEYYYLYRLALP